MVRGVAAAAARGGAARGTRAGLHKCSLAPQRGGRPAERAARPTAIASSYQGTRRPIHASCPSHRPGGTACSLREADREGRARAPLAKPPAQAHSYSCTGATGKCGRLEAGAQNWGAHCPRLYLLSQLSCVTRLPPRPQGEQGPTGSSSTWPSPSTVLFVFDPSGRRVCLGEGRHFCLPSAQH